MSYVVLARRYRPQTFDEVIGQKHIVRTLKNAIQSDRIAHAYLFAGPRGVGKTSLARILSKSLNCASGPTSEPCGVCSSCKDITDGVAVDVIEIDGASNRGIDAVRDLRETVRFLPQKGRFKIYIIDEVHMLTKEAFNALLKTLEEPPPYVKFVFATTEAHKIIPTILSRCQRFDFNRLTPADISERIRYILSEEKITLSERGLNMIVRAASGGMRDALSLLDQVIAYSGTDISDDGVAAALGLVASDVIDALGEAILTRDDSKALLVIEKAYSQGYDILRILDALTVLWRDLMVIASAGDRAEDVTDLPKEEIARLRNALSGQNPEVLLRQLNLLIDAAWGVSQNSDPRTALEVLVLKLMRVADVTPVGELIARLEKGLPIKPTSAEQKPVVQRTPLSSAPKTVAPVLAPTAKQTTAPAHAKAPQEPIEQKKNFSKPPQKLAEEKPAPQKEKSSTAVAKPVASAELSETGKLFEAVILKAIENISPHEGVALRDAKPISFDGKQFVIGVPQGAVSKIATSPKVKEALQKAVAELVASGYAEVKEATSDELSSALSLSLRELERARAIEEAEKLRSTALKNPSVQRALKIFNTSIATVEEDITEENEAN